MLIDKKLWVVIWITEFIAKPDVQIFQTELDASKCKMRIAHKWWCETFPALPKPTNIKEMEELYWEKVGNVRGEFIWIEEV